MKSNKKLSKLSALGYILLLSGLILIIIPLLQRSYNQLSSNKRLEEFYQKQIKRSDEEIKNENKKIDKYNQLVTDSENTSTDPFLEEDNDADLNFIENTDEIFGYIIIPKIDKKLPIYLGASMDHMDKGVGQVAGTHVPVGGKGNRSVLAGHRGWWRDTMLLYVDELVQGDYIYIERAGKTLRYIVDSKEIISKYAWEKLDPQEDKDMVTLLTCLPLGSKGINEKRLIIDTISDEEYNNPKIESKEKDITNLQVNEKDNGQTPSLVKILNTAMLAGALLAIIAFVLVFIKFVRRLGNTFSKK